MLTIKLHAPPHRVELVPRSRLFERLDEGAQRKLTLVSAPAGFGKTTLVSEWLAARLQAAAWLTLDPADGDPLRFLSYVTAALQTLQPGLGDEVLAALRSPRPPSATWLVTELLNDLASLRRDAVLILDDYHVLDARPVDEVLSVLLEHLPPRLHLILTTREDPDLRLARLRARGQLTEVRARDLRFTPAETATFLNELMGLELSREDLAVLEARTEGWIAGLQLAALSMRGREDLSGFIHAFAGDHRYIVDYLVEEVLQRQPEPVRRFLLETSILERLSGPLCDAVTRREGSEAVLQALARATRGDVESALGFLADALVHAEPEGYASTFVDEGPPMQGLLREAVRQGIAASYAGRLLAAFGPGQGGCGRWDRRRSTPSPSVRVKC